MFGGTSTSASAASISNAGNTGGVNTASSASIGAANNRTASSSTGANSTSTPAGATGSSASVSSSATSTKATGSNGQSEGGKGNVALVHIRKRWRCPCHVESCIPKERRARRAKNWEWADDVTNKEVEDSLGLVTMDVDGQSRREGTASSVHQPTSNAETEISQALYVKRMLERKTLMADVEVLQDLDDSKLDMEHNIAIQPPDIRSASKAIVDEAAAVSELPNGSKAEEESDQKDIPALRSSRLRYSIITATASSKTDGSKASSKNEKLNSSTTTNSLSTAKALSTRNSKRRNVEYGVDDDDLSNAKRPPSKNKKLKQVASGEKADISEPDTDNQRLTRIKGSSPVRIFQRCYQIDISQNNSPNSPSPSTRTNKRKSAKSLKASSSAMMQETANRAPFSSTPSEARFQFDGTAYRIPEFRVRLDFGNDDNRALTEPSAWGWLKGIISLDVLNRRDMVVLKQKEGPVVSSDVGHTCNTESQATKLDADLYEAMDCSDSKVAMVEEVSATVEKQVSETKVSNDVPNVRQAVDIEGVSSIHPLELVDSVLKDVDECAAKKDVECGDSEMVEILVEVADVVEETKLKENQSSEGQITDSMVKDTHNACLVKDDAEGEDSRMVEQIDEKAEAVERTKLEEPDQSLENQPNSQQYVHEQNAELSLQLSDQPAKFSAASAATLASPCSDVSYPPKNFIPVAAHCTASNPVLTDDASVNPIVSKTTTPAANHLKEQHYFQKGNGVTYVDASLSTVNANDAQPESIDEAERQRQYREEQLRLIAEKEREIQSWLLMQ
jgi:hypothetical protein